MNNEIKEILDLLRDTADLSFFAVCGTKEELENMPKCVSKRLSITDKQAKLLLDYITNLQQENQELNKENEKWWAIIKDNEQEIKDLCLENSKLEQENQRLKELDENYPIEEELAEAYRREEDYKSKIEKAVEIIDLIKPELWNISNKMTYRLIDIEKVLNGRSDE